MGRAAWESKDFVLTLDVIRELHRLATQDIYSDAGYYRDGPVGISGTDHEPPPPEEVLGHLEDMIAYVNGHWHERPIHLCSYLMWRSTWIDPFYDGNGRTTRALSYLVFIVRLGYEPGGVPTFVDMMAEDKKQDYYLALDDATQPGNSLASTSPPWRIWWGSCWPGSWSASLLRRVQVFLHLVAQAKPRFDSNKLSRHTESVWRGRTGWRRSVIGSRPGLPATGKRRLPGLPGPRLSRLPGMRCVRAGRQARGGRLVGAVGGGSVLLLGHPVGAVRRAAVARSQRPGLGGHGAATADRQAGRVPVGG